MISKLNLPGAGHRSHIDIFSFKQFILELESALGSPIEEHYDPQFHPVDKPNFYIYLVRDDTYFFAVHVHLKWSHIVGQFGGEVKVYSVV
jgi:hypothetical protein